MRLYDSRRRWLGVLEYRPRAGVLLGIRAIVFMRGRTPLAIGQQGNTDDYLCAQGGDKPYRGRGQETGQFSVYEIGLHRHRRTKGDGFMAPGKLSWEAPRRQGHSSTHRKVMIQRMTPTTFSKDS